MHQDAASEKVLNKKILSLCLSLCLCLCLSVCLSLSLSPEVPATCTKLKYIPHHNTLTSKNKCPQKLVGKLVFQIFQWFWWSNQLTDGAQPWGNSRTILVTAMPEWQIYWSLSAGSCPALLHGVHHGRWNRSGLGKRCCTPWVITTWYAGRVCVNW